MRISIIGSGVVGQATGMGLCRHGHSVIFYDINEEKLAKLRKLGYETAETASEAVKRSIVHMICVPTHTVNRRYDLSCVKSAVTSVAKALVKQNEYHVVVIRSTILPLTTRTKVIPLLELHSPLKLGEDYGVCHNPEFCRSAYALNDFLNPKIIVIGELNKQSGDVLEKLYSSFDTSVYRTKLEVAEVIKYVTNLFNATKISFFNEMHMICEKLGINSHEVSEATVLGAIGLTIPKWGIYGGYPFGGDCLPKDLEAFIAFAKENIKHDPILLESVLQVNKEIAIAQRERECCQ